MKTYALIFRDLAALLFLALCGVAAVVSLSPIGG
jgi:hypothetical protein